MASLKPCAHCYVYIAPDETRCPFCRRVQRTTGALPAWILSLSLTGLTACVPGPDDPGPKDTIGNSGPTDGQDSFGNDSLDDDDDWGEGATYAGPDPSSTGSYPGTTSSSTTDDVDSEDWGEAATYAGPDWTTDGGVPVETDTDTDGGSSDESAGDGTSATGGR